MSVVRSNGMHKTAGAPPTAPAAVDAGDASLAAAAANASAPRCDIILLSVRANDLMRAGLAVRAFVIHALEHIYRKVPRASHGVIILEAGIYRAA